MKIATFAKRLPVGFLFISLMVAILSLVVADDREVQANPSETIRLNTLNHGGFYAPLLIRQSSKWAQPFCTGSYGVTLSKIRLWTEGASLPSDGMPIVTIHRNDYEEPGGLVDTLTTPTIDSNIGTAEDFTSSGVELAPYSRYWVVVDRPSNAGRFRMALANREGYMSTGDGGESGWSLPVGVFYSDITTTGREHWTFEDFVRDWSFSMGLYATGTGPTNSPPIMFARDCGNPVGPAEITVDENTPRVTYAVDDNLRLRPITTIVGRLRAHDVEGDTLTYGLTGRDLWKFNRLFNFNSSTGEITIKTGVTINFEEQPYGYAPHHVFHTYHLIATVTDGKDDTGTVETNPTIDDSVPLTMKINNVDERGRVVFVGDRGVEVTTPQVGVRFVAEPRDPDGVLGAGSSVFRLFRSDTHNGAITEERLIHQGAYTPVAADVGKYFGIDVWYIDRECPYVYTPRDFTDDELAYLLSRYGEKRLFGDCTKFADARFTNAVAAAASGQQQQGGTQQPSNSGGRGAPAGPTFTNSGNSVSLKVTEDTAGNTRVAKFDATDPNGDEITFKVTGTDVDAFSDAFDFDTDNGEIEVKPDGTLDYESKQRYSVTVSVTDGKDSSGNAEDQPTMDDSVEVAIGVVNVNDPGVVTLSMSTPEIRSRVTATLTDDDGIFTSSNSPVVWRWHISGVESGSAFTEIAGATANSYTPVPGDLGKRLKAKATYSDRLAQGQVATSEASDPVAFANRRASGAPTISGTAQEGETLTASTTAITDADGLINATFAYQWLADETEITSATGSSYTVTASEVGKAIKVRVSFTDDANHAETLTSVATASVTARSATVSPNTAASGAPTISGTAQEGETLTAATTGITDADGLVNTTFAHQWLANDVEIASATGSDYTLTASEVGRTIKVRVSFTDDAGNAEELTSAATGAVSARANSPAAGSPSISGTAQEGETLTASTTAITDADGLVNAMFAYQWLADDTEIASATGSSYTVTASEVGKTIKVRVSFTDDVGNSEEVTSGATASVKAQLSATILDAPSAHDGTDFTFELRFSETPKRLFSYRTLRDHAFTVTGGEVTYVRRLERGKNVRWEITVTPSSNDSVSIELPATTDCRASRAICTDDDRKLQAMPATVIPGPSQQTAQNSPATGSPTISGTPQVGETLTASTTGITDADGLDNVSYAYQWLANDVAIDQATGSAYTLTSDEVGSAIKARVSFTDDAGNAEELTSAATGVVSARANSPAAGAPTISGTAQVGETLTAVTTGVTDADGLDNVAYTYEWFAGATQIGGAASSAYVLTDAEKGSLITVRVSFTDDSGNPEALTSVATSAVTGPPLTATILDAPSSHDGADFTFELRFSEQFTLSYRTLWDHAFTVTGGEVSHVRRLERGKNARWEITVTPSSDDSVSIELPATTDCSSTGAICTGDDRKLQAIPATTIPGPSQQTSQNSPAAGAPTISGTAQVGETLTAATTSITDADGVANVSYAYQWLANDVEIASATGSDYTLTASEVGRTIKVRVSFTDDTGNAEELNSAATGAVYARANTPAAGAPTISGTAQVGETLTAATTGITDADGLDNVAYTYEWFAGATQIGGAASSTYVVTDAEKGSLITVRVSFTDDLGNPETLTSAATTEVAGPPLTATIRDAPSSHDGTDFTFELRFSEQFTLSYRTLWDHAFTVTGGEVSHVRRLERGKNVRWEITIRPSSDDSVTIQLPATTDCGASGAICANDERKLSGGLQITVPRSGG